MTASSRKKDTISIGASNLLPINTIKTNPLPLAFFTQFLYFFNSRHSPISSTLHASCIIIYFKSNFIINSFKCINRISTILRHCVIFPFAVFVCIPAIIIFDFGFTPSIVSAKLLWRFSLHITTRPFYRKTKIYSMRMIRIRTKLLQGDLPHCCFFLLTLIINYKFLKRLFFFTGDNVNY